MQKNAYTVCNLCKGEVDENVDYCPHCGAVFNTDFMCSAHPYISALAVCVACHKSLCHRDIFYYHARAYCFDHHPGRLNGEDKPYSTLWKGCFENVVS